jgi:uncharacterized protein YlxP (DUF503 family)
MYVWTLTIRLRLESRSLKEKRGIVKSVLARARNNFNVASAEVDLHDLHGGADIAFVTVSPDRMYARNLLERLEEWLAEERPDLEVVASEIEER